MKTIIKIMIAILITSSFSESSFAGYPKYKLSVENLNYTSPNSLEFDIYMLNTNSGKSELVYLSGQYFLDFNTEIANKGMLKYTIISSGLPESSKPLKATIFENQLRIACNQISLDSKNVPVISRESHGTLIAKMRLETSADKFEQVPLELKWSSENKFKTKISILENNKGIEITNHESHTINYSPDLTEGDEITGLPDKFSLSQNYPNPFNPVTKIKFDIPSFVNGGVNVKLVVYNIAGIEVATLLNGRVDAGSHEISFDGKAHSSGVYFYKITAGDYSKTMRMVLIK